METDVASTPKQRPPQHTSRPLLLPSYAGNEPPGRPKAREITSRYLSLSTSSSSSVSSSSTTSSSVKSGSSISSRRSQSPILGSRNATTTPKSLQRGVSAEGRRSPLTSAEKMLVTSARSQSVSFQGESYAAPATKVKLPPTPAPVATPGGLRKATPERRKLGVMTPVSDRREKNSTENSRPIDQQLQKHRWPGRLRAENSNFLTQSLDCGSDKAKLSGSGFVLRDLRRKSMVDGSNMRMAITELKLKNGIKETREINEVESGRRFHEPLVSDVESLNTVQLSKRVDKAPDPTSPLSNYASKRTIGPSKLTLPKKFPNDSPVSSPRELYPSRGLSPIRAASPCRALSSSSGAVLRGIVSPSRIRSKTGSSMSIDSTCSRPSALSFATDARRGKLGENQIADAHDLRLLHNRLLQWRFVNAKAEHTILVQRHTAERSLYDAWTTTSKLRNSVKSKEIELQLLRRSQKLNDILKKQEPHLENWGLLDRDYQKSVSDAIKALEASTIRLPVCGATADVLKVQEAIISAVDVMQATTSAISSLLVKKVEQMNLLVYELKKLSSRQHCLLDEVYGDLFARTFIPLQVMECSLRSRILQGAKGGKGELGKK